MSPGYCLARQPQAKRKPCQLQQLKFQLWYISCIYACAEVQTQNPFPFKICTENAVATVAPRESVPAAGDQLGPQGIYNSSCQESGRGFLIRGQEEHSPAKAGNYVHGIVKMSGVTVGVRTCQWPLRLPCRKHLGWSRGLRANDSSIRAGPAGLRGPDRGLDFSNEDT
jgi:hypothetical protein